jgi:hypothetical protein
VGVAEWVKVFGREQVLELMLGQEWLLVKSSVRVLVEVPEWGLELKLALGLV